MEEKDFVKNSEEKVEVGVEEKVEAVPEEELIAPVQKSAGSKLKEWFKKGKAVYLEILNKLLFIGFGVWAFFGCKKFYLDEKHALEKAYSNMDLSAYPSEYLDQMPFKRTLLMICIAAMAGVFVVVTMRGICLVENRKKANGDFFVAAMFAFMGAMIGVCMFYFDYIGALEGFVQNLIK